MQKLEKNINQTIINSNADEMILKIAELLISSRLTEGQKILRIYDIFETLLQELHGAEKTLEYLNDKYCVDSKRMASSMKNPQLEKYKSVKNYMKNIRFMTACIGQFLYENLYEDKMSNDYKVQIENHYIKLNRWDADIRSNIIRRLQVQCRGFKFHKLLEKSEFYPRG